MIVRTLTLVLLVALLAGCDTTDPRRGGFVGGVGGLMSGEYDRRLALRQGELDRLDAAESSLDRRIAGAKATASTLDRRVTALSRNVSRLRARQDELDARTGGSAALRAERDRLRAELFALTARNSERNRIQAELRGERGGSTIAEHDLSADEELASRLMREQEEQLSRLR